MYVVCSGSLAPPRIDLVSHSTTIAWWRGSRARPRHGACPPH